MKTVAVTQARIASTRLPEKVLLEVKDKTLLEIHLERILRAQSIDELIVATTQEEGAERIVDLCRRMSVRVSRGSTDDVLDRFYCALDSTKPDYVVRLTSDCPLIDPSLIDEIVKKALELGVDYCSNTLNPTYPDGVDVEVFRFSALEKAWREAELKSDREHVTPYIWRNSNYKGGVLFSSHSFESSASFAGHRITVDEVEDIELIRVLVEELGDGRPWMEYISYLNDRPDLMAMNSQFKRNEGFERSLRRDHE